MSRAPVSVCLVVLAAGCNDHRYGFFGDEQAGAETTEADETGPASTTTTTDPSPPGPVTVTTMPLPPDPDPSTVSSDPTLPDPTGPAPSVCGEVVLASEVPLQVVTDNGGGGDVFAMACVDTVGAESVFVWTAPFAGVFRFDTVGSGIDTVMTVLGDFCGGPVLGCNDDTLQLFSEVTAELDGGAPVTIVVEGLGGQTGPIAVNISQVDELPPPTCAARDLGSALGGFGGSTVFAGNEWAGGCGGDGATEQVFVWTAPVPATYRLRAIGLDFNPLIYARIGDCEGLEIACNDDFEGFDAAFDVLAGPADGPLFVFVDGVEAGNGGEFTLDISPL